MSKIRINVDSGYISLQFDSTEVENWQDCLRLNRVQMQQSIQSVFLIVIKIWQRNHKNTYTDVNIVQ